MHQYKFITVEGNTGAGKTTLTRMLANDYNGSVLLEEFVDNPFLPLFYANPDRYAFQTEMYFLLDRHKQLCEIVQTDNFIKSLHISDYLLNKSLLYAEANLQSQEYELFTRFFNLVYPNLPKPEIIIYIHATVPRLIQNIKQRGRGFEQQVRHEYLQKVEDIYLQYFKKNPDLSVLLIHADNMDFVAHPEHYEQIKQWLSKPYTQGIHELKL